MLVLSCRREAAFPLTSVLVKEKLLQGDLLWKKFHQETFPSTLPRQKCQGKTRQGNLQV